MSTLNATFQSGDTLNASLGQSDALDAALDSTVYIPVANDYTGPYTVTPSEETQTLGTNDLHMTDDVTVNPIPSEYIVPSGKTVISENSLTDISPYQYASVQVPDGITFANGVTF